MSLKVTRHPETGKIIRIKTGEGVFSYSYLVSPRPEDSLNPGTYGTDFIIKDDETLSAIKEYLKEQIVEGKERFWNNTVPKDLHIPLRQGKEDVELERGYWVLSTKSKSQPALFILDKETGRAREVETEEDMYEIYSGMVGEVIIALRPYSYKGIRGITCYVNAVCKTGTGTPIGVRTTDYKSEFSLEGAFESEFNNDEEVPTPKTEKKEVAEDVSLDDLLGDTNNKESKKENEKEITLDDLLS